MMNIPQLPQNGFMSGLANGQNLDNAFVQGQYLPAQEKAKTQLMQMQAKYGMLPGQMRGPAANVMSLQAIGNRFGFNSPQYQMAKSGIEVDNKSKMAKANYYNQNLWAKNLHGAAFYDAAAKRAEAAGDTNAANMFKNAAIKASSDSTARNKLSYGTNIEKTLASIDPSVEAMYSGPLGELRLAKDHAEAWLTNKPNPNLLQHAKNKGLIHGLTSQITKFYGSSVTPEAQHALSLLFTPSLGTTGKELKARYQALSNLFKQERGTYQSQINSPAIYTEPESQVVANVRKNVTFPGKQSPNVQNSVGYRSSPTGNKSDPLGIR